MGPPTVTPSPHRFAVRPPRGSAASKQQNHPFNTPQFNPTPRFASAAFQKNANWDNTRAVSPIRQPTRQQEAIEDVSELDHDIYDSIEMEPILDLDYESGDACEYDDIAPNPTKRRRLSPSQVLDSQLDDAQAPATDDERHDHDDDFEDLLSSSIPEFVSPQAASLNRPPSSIVPRFLTPSTPVCHPSTPADTQTPGTFLKPPRFRPPDEQALIRQPSEPLPDAFSPNRRGQKFLAGGLAAEVRGWIFALESTSSAHAVGRTAEHPWAVKLVADEVCAESGARMTLVRGRQIRPDITGQNVEVIDYLGIVRVILAGESMAKGLEKRSRVDVGRTVGIKGPVWEVVIEGVRWGVAVSWKVLT